MLAYDVATNSLLLREPGAHNGVCTLRILNVPYIKVFACCVHDAWETACGTEHQRVHDAWAAASGMRHA